MRSRLLSFINQPSADAFILLALVVLFFISILLRLNGSSVQMFCFSEQIGCAINQGISIGQPRAIRSDEWRVGTPFMLAQDESGNIRKSPLLGSGITIPLLSPSVFSHWSAVFKPFSVLTLILDTTSGFSVFWMGMIFGLVAVVYSLLRQLKIAPQYAILAAFSLLFTSFIQWWNAFPTVALPLGIILLSFWWLRKSNTSILTILSVTVLFIFVLSSNFHQLYPPYQIPLFILCSFVIVGFSIDQKIYNDRKKLLVSILVASISLLISSLLFLLYLSEFRVETTALIESSYPGQRISSGGDFPQFRLLSSFFDIQLLNDHKPMGSYNQSEAAGFPNISLFLIPVVVANEFYSRRKHKANSYFMLSLLLYIFFIAGWMFVGYPGWLAKLTLLERVPANRADIGFGIASFLLTTSYVFSYRLFLKTTWWKYVLGGIGFLAVLLNGFYLRDAFPAYISSIPKILLISSTAGFLIFTAVTQRRREFAISFLAFSLISTLSVHPLRQGLSPITDSEFMKQVVAVNHADPGRWAVFNSSILGPLLYANGIQSASGTYLYPQTEWWMQFDPAATSKVIWNRYAHVYFLESTDYQSDSIEFILTSPDSFAVQVSPCNRVFNSIDVKYLTSTSPLKSQCLTEIPKGVFQHQIHIYRRKDVIDRAINLP
jgi:hypothetical protein